MPNAQIDGRTASPPHRYYIYKSMKSIHLLLFDPINSLHSVQILKIIYKYPLFSPYGEKIHINGFNHMRIYLIYVATNLPILFFFFLVNILIFFNKVHLIFCIKARLPHKRLTEVELLHCCFIHLRSLWRTHNWVPCDSTSIPPKLNRGPFTGVSEVLNNMLHDY